jgi:hypothetical protein
MGAGVVGSSGRYDISGCTRESRMRFLNENFSFLSFMEKDNIGMLYIDDSFGCT